jgi:hypothetical protein
VYSDRLAAVLTAAPFLLAETPDSATSRGGASMMVDLFGADANLWMAGAAVAEAIIVGAAAAFAFGQVREARLTREDQSRPFVIVDFDLSRPPFIHLMIKNIGKSMARKVRIQTDPPLASTFDKERQADPISKLGPFTEEIPTMAPDREIRILFDSFPQREQQKLDDAYRVTVTYEGERGRSYVDEMVLDLGIYRNISYIEQHTIHDVHKQLKKIADSVDRWGAGVGRGSGLLGRVSKVGVSREMLPVWDEET